MPFQRSQLRLTVWEKVRHSIFGKPKDPHDPNIGHQLSLVAFLAWVGLGVDGLSSSAYGPEEAFRALGDHGYIAIMLAVATALTVFVISYAYSRLIEHFPHGGGGYVVATQLLGKPAGVVSGSALLVDYVLTISVSIAGGGDAIFSLLPLEYHVLKLPLEFGAIILLVVLNLRGVKETVSAVVPFFLLFLVMHVIMIVGGILFHLGDVPALVERTRTGFTTGVAQMGKWGIFLLFLRGYSMGGGTYTGIEAVSNGVGALREPRVQTGKKTMLYLAVSLSLTAGGLLICYMLFNLRPVEGQTLNAVLAHAFFGNWTVFGINVGYWLVLATLFSESILLVVAAQTGFIDGPRVMANMAVDSWLPRRFASLSDRLTMKNGILLMGFAAVGTLMFTGGKIGILVVMYSINVFVTFSLSQVAMIKFWITTRKEQKHWKRNFLIHSICFLMCFSILCVMIIEKFLEGAWATMVITGACISICVFIRRHYRAIGQRIKHIELRNKAVARSPLKEMPNRGTGPVPDFDPTKPTAAILVGGYSRLGRRSMLAVLKFFPKTFHNIVFLSIGVINSDFFKNAEIDSIENRTEETLKGYVAIANRIGLPAKYAFRTGTDVVREASELCLEVSQNYQHVVFFAGEVVFENAHWFDKILHNETAYAIQRQIRSNGLPMVILPVVIHDEQTPDVHDADPHLDTPSTTKKG